MSSNHLLCLGYGFCAKVLAARLRTRGWQVTGTTRGDTMSDPDLIDYNSDEVESCLRSATHVLLSVPPGDGGDPVHRRFLPLFKESNLLEWAGYLSTTGVYGDSAGAWVDENTLPDPTSARTQRRLSAEMGWRELHVDHELPLHIFRLAGIYGPGRSPLDAVSEGRARRIRRKGHLFSRTHVTDIATVLEASIRQPEPGTVYNICDDEPAEPCAVTEYACKLLGVSPPPMIAFEEADLNPLARSFWQDNRKVRNKKIKEDLGVTLDCPNYRVGLQRDFETTFRVEGGVSSWVVDS